MSVRVLVHILPASRRLLLLLLSSKTTFASLILLSDAWHIFHSDEFIRDMAVFVGQIYLDGTLNRETWMIIAIV